MTKYKVSYFIEISEEEDLQLNHIKEEIDTYLATYTGTGKVLASHFEEWV